MPLPLIDVAVSIVRAPDGRVLLAERTARQVAAGFWELPGGKIEEGESAEEAAARELDEEIGIKPDALRPWISYVHAYRTKRVRLRFFSVDRWRGEPRGRENQRLAWVDPTAPAVAPLLPSNERVMRALGLPRLCAIVRPDEHDGHRTLLGRLRAAMAGGLRLIQLRDRHSAPDQRVAFARRVVEAARPYRAQVLVAGPAIEARRAGATGVYSCARDLRRLSSRPEAGFWMASCRDADDLARAVSLGADVAVLALTTASQAEATPLGWDDLKRLVATTPITVYAQGGLKPDDLDMALGSGAAGIAVEFGEIPTIQPTGQFGTQRRSPPPEWPPRTH